MQVDEIQKIEGRNSKNTTRTTNVSTVLDKIKTVFHWSSGKDSALALFHLMNDSRYQVSQLLTTINSYYQRVTMHGTPIELLKKQLRSIGLPYTFVELPESPSMAEYESRVKKTMIELKKTNITHAAYGDIFLEDLKNYREREMKKVGFETIFSIWKRDTFDLIKEFINHGFQAKIICANSQLGPDFLGRQIDTAFLSDLPSGIDPCGENGEFHTFCYDGPLFSSSVEFDLGEKIKRTYPDPKSDGSVDFWFINLVT